MGHLCPRSIPLRIPEIDSVVDINDGDEKGKSSYVINSIHTGSNCPFGSQFPCCFRQPPGLMKYRRPHFSEAARASILLMGLCGWDSHILTVTSARCLQLCSVQHCLLTSFWAHSTVSTLLLTGPEIQIILIWTANAANTLAGGLWLNILGSLTPWHLSFGVYPRDNNMESLLGKN